MSVTFVGDTIGPVTVPARATASLSSFRDWAGTNDLPEKTKVFFYRGEVWIDMGKEQIFEHVAVKTEFARVLAGIVRQEDLGEYFVDGALLTNTTAQLSANPDSIFVSHDSFDSARVKLTKGKRRGIVELLGSPDMVLEVVSDSSERKDNQTLFEGYLEAGIAEYWLVDARGAEIEFTIYKSGEKRFTAIRKQSGGWQKSGVFGKSFRLIRKLNRRGNPQFTLEVR